MAKSQKPSLHCANCGEPIRDLDAFEIYKPFCSKRCKMVDLGKWLREEYSIPAEPVEPNVKNEDDDNYDK